MNRIAALILGFIVLMTTEARGQVATPDSLALVALYTATSGANWTENTNWLTGPVSTWFGISTVGSRVTVVDLNDNDLEGTIPPELGDLTHLDSLDLGNNAVSGEIPPELGNLTALIALNLSFTHLSGQIPTDFSKLTNLAILNLGAARLAGGIPSFLGDLGTLTELYLYGNFLGGEIPPELGKLTNLTTLELWNCDLSGEIRPTLGNLTSLNRLHLFHNSLSGAIPPELGNLSALTHIALGDNELTGGVPPEFGNLRDLIDLEIHLNPLAGTLPLSLANLSNLSLFWFDNTNLCEPADPGFQTWLQSINNVHSTGCTNVATEEFVDVARGFSLGQNYPNPFKSSTEIPVQLAEAGHASLVVFDLHGREVARQVVTTLPAGSHTIPFDGVGLASGVYFYRLTIAGYSELGRMTLLE